MSDSRLVFSTEFGRIKPEDEPQQPEVKRFKDGHIRIERQTKGRKGKGVMLVVGIDPSEHDLKKLAKLLKSKMGQGGAVKEGVIEIQGDDREKLKGLLVAQGFKVKLAGG
ncbi:stress response translation initiation inhibitor YciH [Pseudoalteromonas sp. SMS1]|uniref:stress response translation initiation inhibitor YciH n=1 Tax=Pseudoalteromonas sp. SMS1 TaxID=2908894 RepID=UPI001F2DCFBD|nr:stress response translation initiation inhibitor YciH [Pseudoalteromonas sp. SMS1]MCF2856306.1 stress response translation initiation inhibitor YciH [Pseudoalteromonas sp. SMS1]